MPILIQCPDLAIDKIASPIELPLTWLYSCMCLSLSVHSKVLEAEALAKMELSNPANFGPKKYFLRECMSEVEGQVPHPRFVPLPKEMTGKYRAKLAAGTDD